MIAHTVVNQREKMLAMAKRPRRASPIPGVSTAAQQSPSGIVGGTTFSGFSHPSANPSATMSKKYYPAPLVEGDYIDHNYTNDMVKDIQAMKSSLEDKINAMQERIELQEDDVNES